MEQHRFGEMSHNPEHSISYTLSKYLLGEGTGLGSRFWATAGGPALQDPGMVEDNGFNRDGGEPHKVLFGNCSGPLNVPIGINEWFGDTKCCEVCSLDVKEETG